MPLQTIPARRRRVTRDCHSAALSGPSPRIANKVGCEPPQPNHTQHHIRHTQPRTATPMADAGRQRTAKPSLPNPPPGPNGSGALRCRRPGAKSAPPGLHPCLPVTPARRRCVLGRRQHGYSGVRASGKTGTVYPCALARVPALDTTQAVSRSPSRGNTLLKQGCTFRDLTYVQSTGIWSRRSVGRCPVRHGFGQIQHFQRQAWRHR